MEREFEFKDTEKFFNARFNREFENTLLDTFWPDRAKRCVDRYGDAGWVVGDHKAIELPRIVIPHSNWVIRDRDEALINMPDEGLRIESDGDRYDRTRHYIKLKHRR